MPHRWWERAGPVAVWHWGDLWPSYLAEHAHRDEPLLAELGPRVAACLGLSPGHVVVGSRVYFPPSERSPVVGQMRLEY